MQNQTLVDSISLPSPCLYLVKQRWTSCVSIRSQYSRTKYTTRQTVLILTSWSWASVGPQRLRQSCFVAAGCLASHSAKRQLSPVFSPQSQCLFPILTLACGWPCFLYKRIDSVIRAPPAHRPTPSLCTTTAFLTVATRAFSHVGLSTCAPISPLPTLGYCHSCPPLSSLHHQVFILHWVHISSKVLLFLQF